MEIKLLIFILLLTSNLIYSQSDSTKIKEIESKVLNIESKLSMRISDRTFQIDSINVKFKQFENKYIALSKFNNSNNQLLTEFYFEEENLFLIRFTEPSMKFKKEDDINKTTEYFYENEKLIDEQISINIPDPVIGLGIPMFSKWNEVYGYNKKFTSEFLQSYAELLLTKINE